MLKLWKRRKRVKKSEKRQREGKSSIANNQNLLRNGKKTNLFFFNIFLKNVSTSRGRNILTYFFTWMLCAPCPIFVARHENKCEKCVDFGLEREKKKKIGNARKYSLSYIAELMCFQKASCQLKKNMDLSCGN